MVGSFRRGARIVGLAAVLVLGASACSKESTPTAPIYNVFGQQFRFHGMPKSNTEFNQGQPIQNMEFDHTFDKAEVMVPFKCDVHPWMNAYVGVLTHPYYAVSGDDGSFSIDKLPPGTYTLEAWHEELGTATQQVTVAANQTAEVTFDVQPKTGG